MKISRNKLYPHGVARLTGLTMGLVMLACAPAGAQRVTEAGINAGPVDLLATIAPADNADNSSLSTPTVGSIDDAIKSVLDESAPAEGAGNAAAAPAPATATLTTTETGATPSTLTTTQPATQPVPQPASQGVTETLAEAAPADEGTASASVSLTRGTVVTSFGVANIGLEPSGDDAAGLTTTIWRGTPVDRAILLLDSKAAVGASPALSTLAQRIVAHRAVPPVGADANAGPLVAARLAWLASAGRSEALEDLVGQLPDEEPWLQWKQWLVETQLMSRRDDEACRTVMYQVSRTFEPFWHKAKVICSAAMGDTAGAQFAADILKAMGVDDAAFSALVSTLLDGTDAGEFDPALLEPLHIVLMDAAHTAIDTDGLSALAEGSVQTAVGLRYLDPEARLVSTWRALDRGLIAHEKAGKLWRSAKITPDDIDLALARHRSQPSALTRALGWRALDAERSSRRLAFVAAMMDADIASGAGLMMAPLYAELAREALAFDGAAEVLATDPALAAKLGMLVSIGGSGDLPDMLSTPEVRAWKDLLGLAAGAEAADIAPLDLLQMWHLLPLVEQASLTGTGAGTDRDWIGLAMPADAAPVSYLSVSPLMLRALRQAAESGSVAETVLLAHRIVGNLDLAEMHPADAAGIVAALMAVGQQDTARALSVEVAAAHLMAAMRSVEIALPPRLDLAAAATGAEENTEENTGEKTEENIGDNTGEDITAGDATDTGNAVEATDAANSDDAANADDANSGTDAGSATQAATGAQQDANADS